MTAIVEDTIRDSILNRLMLVPENKLCFDCKSSNPKWASVTNGIFICFHCAGRHRDMGVHISFVRSLTLDIWNKKQLKMMELGGNKNASIYWEQHDLKTSDAVKAYADQAAQEYRSELKKKAEQETNTETEINTRSLSREINPVVAAEPKKATEGIAAKPNPFMKVQKITGSASSSATKKPTAKAMNAKAIDIDFDELGLAPAISFESSKKAPALVENAQDTQTEEEKEKDSKEPGLLLSNNKLKEQREAGFTGSKKIPEKLKNKKAISSEEYYQYDEQFKAETKVKLARFANAKSISSSDYYGGNTKKEEQTEDEVLRHDNPSGLAIAKNVGIALFESAKEKVKDLKDYATNWISSIRKGSEDSS